MDYKLNIQEDINWLMESIFLLDKTFKYKGNFDREDFTLIENEEKFQGSIEEIHKDFSDVLEFQVNILEDVNELYRPGTIWESLANDLTPGRAYDDLLSSMAMNTKYKDIDDISKEEFLLMSFRDFANIFYNQGIEPDSYDELKENRYKSSYFTEDSYKYTLDDIYELVEMTNLASEQKYGILKLYAEVDEVYEDFISLLKKCEKIIKKHYHLVQDRLRAKVDELKTDEGKKRLEEIFKIEELFSSMSKEVKGKLNFSGEYFVYVGILMYNAGAIRTATNPSHSPYIIFGIILAELKEMTHRSDMSKREIIDKTKAIGDETRFEILERLDERPYYLKELAEYFDTSSASISHHLNILTESNLVRSYYDDRKAYYTLNKKAFKSLADNLIDFTKEDEDGKEG